MNLSWTEITIIKVLDVHMYSDWNVKPNSLKLLDKCNAKRWKLRVGHNVFTSQQIICFCWCIFYHSRTCVLCQKRPSPALGIVRALCNGAQLKAVPETLKCIAISHPHSSNSIEHSHVCAKCREHSHVRKCVRACVLTNCSCARTSTL